jgi:hypothetical protein
MAITPANLPDIIGLALAVILSIAMLSQLAVENHLLRFAQSLLVGSASGYILALVWRTVIWPRAVLLVQQPAQHWHYGLFFALGILLLGRGLRKTSILANLPLGAMFGIGAALALGGALAGTVIPLVRSIFAPFLSNSASPEWPIGLVLVNAGLAAIGTLVVLGAFHVTLPRRGPARLLVRAWSGIGRTLGQGLIMLTLGAIYAGAIVSFYTLLSGRFAFFYNAAVSLLARIGL